MLHEFYDHKRILITGHTGFKGSWLALWLQSLGADVFGYALDPRTGDDHYLACNLDDSLSDQRGDIRDPGAVASYLKEICPELVFHLAAQPIVLESYRDARYTFETNSMGTLNILDACLNCSSVKSIVVITTDKCYENSEAQKAFAETDPLGGHDPYSASKANAEIIATSYFRSFFQERGVGVATARAGNVIGGGDWQEYRLIPDIMRAVKQGAKLEIRNPQAIRPWQHVMEPLSGYLTLGEKLHGDFRKYSGAWNFGPDPGSFSSVGDLVGTLGSYFPTLQMQVKEPDNPQHEAGFLTLDSSKAKNILGWEGRLGIEASLDLTFDWYLAQLAGDPMRAKTLSQIKAYEELTHHA